jgi:hypothetical protein
MEQRCPQWSLSGVKVPGEWFHQDDPSTIPKLVAGADGLTVVITNTAAPTRLTVGIYPGAIDEIDPSVKPRLVFDCLSGDECKAAALDNSISLDLAAVWPAEAVAAVFSVQADYLGSDGHIAYGNTVAWAMQITRPNH